MEQRSPEWFAARRGKVTASQLHAVMAVKKDGSPTQARLDYMMALVAERLTGLGTERFETRYMRDGTAREERAQIAYEMLTGREIEMEGFVDHPSIGDFGVSPDGVVRPGYARLVEFKGLTRANHVEMLLGYPPEQKYLDQVQGQMSATGAQVCDLCFFNPEFPGLSCLCIREIRRDPARIGVIEAAVRAFLAEIETSVAKIRADYGIGDDA